MGATTVKSPGRKQRTNGGAQPSDLGRTLAAEIASAANGNGNGNGRRNGNGNGNGKGRGVPKPQARRIAVRFGGSMLAAASIDTARHSDDVVIVARALCEEMGIKGTERQDLLAGARLHDIGKVGVPSEILKKAGPLTESEWKQMREHTVIGDRVLSSVPELAGIAKLVRHSHERWDGRGYPDGLSREEIPLGSRVIFCADAFHAIREDRPYREGRSARAALAELKRGAGTQFDPTVVTAFERVVRDLGMVPPPGTSSVRRSKRLMALLMMLVIGGAGSAVARTNLLGDPAPAGPGAAATPAAIECGSAQCASMLGTSLNEIFGGEDPQIHVGARTSGAGVPGAPLQPASPGGSTPGTGPAGGSVDTPDGSADAGPFNGGEAKTPLSGGSEDFSGAGQPAQQDVDTSGSAPSTPVTSGDSGKGSGSSGHGGGNSHGHGHAWGGGSGGGKDHPGGGSSHGGGGPGSSGSGGRGSHGSPGSSGGPGSTGSGSGGSGGSSGSSGTGGSSGSGGSGGSHGHGGGHH